MSQNSSPASPFEPARYAPGAELPRAASPSARPRPVPPPAARTLARRPGHPQPVRRPSSAPPRSARHRPVGPGGCVVVKGEAVSCRAAWGRAFGLCRASKRAAQIGLSQRANRTGCSHDLGPILVVDAASLTVLAGSRLMRRRSVFGMGLEAFWKCLDRLLGKASKGQQEGWQDKASSSLAGPLALSCCLHIDFWALSRSVRG